MSVKLCALRWSVGLSGFPVLVRREQQLRRASVAVLGLLSGCASSASGRPAANLARTTVEVSREPLSEVRLVPPPQIEGDFTWRQLVSVRYGEEQQQFEAVIQKTSGQLLLVGLTPAMTRLFVVTQTQDGVRVEGGEQLGIKPEVILNYVHQALFWGLFPRNKYPRGKCLASPSASGAAERMQVEGKAQVRGGGSVQSVVTAVKSSHTREASARVGAAWRERRVDGVRVQELWQASGLAERKIFRATGSYLRIGYVPAYCPGSAPANVTLSPSDGTYLITIQSLG